MKIKLAENIRTLRKNHSLTQEQLAEALGVTTGAVYKWESGLSIPEIKLIMEIADLFEISVDVLLGYEQQNGNIENRAARIEQCIKEKNFEEAVVEAEKALKKYPNIFDIVYISAVMYQCKFSEEKDENALERSNELYRHAITLLYQNKDSHINEVTILNHIAENYLLAEKTEQALEILKQNNICGINDSLIGFTYAIILKQPQEASRYLIMSFANTLGQISRTLLGLANMYTELKDEAGMEALLWLIDFLDSIKIQKDSLAFTDKAKAGFMAQYAVWKAEFGDLEQAKESVTNAYSLAKQFDAAPIYNMQGIRFFDGEADTAVFYDSMGKTAMETIENILFDKKNKKEAQKLVQDIWRELTNEKGE